MRTSLRIDDRIARIVIDDGKVNAMTTEMLGEICERLDEAAHSADVTAVCGRPGIFSAGFNMPTFSDGLEPTLDMLLAGMRAILKMLAHPHPTVAGCTGHAFPMSAFLMLCSDRRIGVRGEYAIGMNEVAIGLTVPHFALALAQHRLNRSGFAQVVTGQLFDPDAAVAAGYLDSVVGEDELDDTVLSVARQLRGIDLRAYVATKQRINHSVSARIGELCDRDTLAAELEAAVG